MKVKISLLIAGLLASNVAMAGGGVLTGKVRLACEAILCLSTGSPPNECSPSLTEYFDIDFDDWDDTLDARIDFLELCPVASQTPQMQSLVRAIANGAGRCDAASLNATLVSYVGGGGMGGIGQGCISSQKPTYCTAYDGHEYTDLGVGATYIIDPPQNNGFWPFQGVNMGMGGIGFGGIGGQYQTPQNCGHWVD